MTLKSCFSKSKVTKMSNYITEENKDSDLSKKLQTFLTNASANQVALKLTAPELAALNDATLEFDDALSISNTSKATTVQLVSDKNVKKRTIKQLVAQYAQEWRGDLSVSDAILDALLLPNHQSGGTRTAPTQPTNPTLKVTGAGEITFGWNRNGNRNGTIFNVETAEAIDGPWATYDMTTKVKMGYQGTPGVAVWFRVNAKRNGQSSAYSFPISMWGNGTGEADLTIAA